MTGTGMVTAVGQGDVNVTATFGGQVGSFHATIAPSPVTALLSKDENGPGPDAHTIIQKLLAHEWRIVHLAGHAFDDPDGHPERRLYPAVAKDLLNSRVRTREVERSSR